VAEVKKIGVFDSGLGGLTVLKTLQRELPGCSFVYLGDTARTPYGSKSGSTVVRYSVECATFLARHDIDLLVVACNTASSVALEEIARVVSCPVIGTIAPAVRECLSHQEREGGLVGILGTRATIQSAAYQRAIHSANPAIALSAQPCPLFVPLVEEGITSGPIVEKIVEFYLRPLREEGVSSLILGCTHYPLLLGPIRDFMGNHIAIVECADAIAREIQSSHDIPLDRGGTSRFFVTDEVSRFNSLASTFLQGALVEAIKVDSLGS
jgi:glutamate racemase